MAAPNLTISQKNFETLLFGGEDTTNLGVDASGEIFYQKPLGWTSWLTSFNTPDTSRVTRIAIERMLTDLNEHWGDFRLTGDREIQSEEIRHVVFEKLGATPEKLFNRCCLFHMKNLQNLLVPKLGTLRGETDKSTANYKMEKSIAKADLMFKLKVGIKINKGATRSIIVSWFDQKEIAIYKPHHTDQSWDLVFMDYLKYQLNMQVSHLSTSKMARPRAEVAVHIIDQYFDLGITCQTEIAALGNTTGSFQLFEHEMVEAKRIKAILDAKLHFHPKEVLNFQIMTILDYLIGDLDGHEENWLVRRGERGCLIGELKKIDNANSFIQRNPDNLGYLTDTKQYVWKEWRIAENRFTTEARELMQRITHREVETIIEIIRRKLPGFLDQQMISLFLQRAEVLRLLANIDSASPKMLGDLQTDQEIVRFIVAYKPAPASAVSAESVAEEFLFVEEEDEE